MIECSLFDWNKVKWVRFKVGLFFYLFKGINENFHLFHIHKIKQHQENKSEKMAIFFREFYFFQPTKKLFSTFQLIWLIHRQLMINQINWFIWFTSTICNTWKLITHKKKFCVYSMNLAWELKCMWYHRNTVWIKIVWRVNWYTIYVH